MKIYEKEVSKDEYYSSYNSEDILVYESMINEFAINEDYIFQVEKKYIDSNGQYDVKNKYIFKIYTKN